MDERRQTVQLINHWKKVKFESPMPIIESFDIQFISNKILNSMVIFANNNITNKNYHIEFMGKDIIDMNRLIEDQLTSPLIKVINKLSLIAKRSLLITDQGYFIDKSYNSHKYRSCLLPFGHNKNIASHFVMYISYS